MKPVDELEFEYVDEEEWAGACEERCAIIRDKKKTVGSAICFLLVGIVFTVRSYYHRMPQASARTAAAHTHTTAHMYLARTPLSTNPSRFRCAYCLGSFYSLESVFSGDLVLTSERLCSFWCC